MKKLRKNLHGFTLMEVLVALAISTLMLTGVLALMAPSSKMFHDTAVLQQQRQICRTINTGIDERLRYATDIIVIKNTSGYPNCESEKYYNYSAIMVSNGDITYNGRTVKGVVYLKDKLFRGIERKLLTDDYREKYNFNFNVSANGYDLKTEVLVYRIDANSNMVDKLNTNNIVRMKNLELNNTPITEIDASTMRAQPDPDLTIKPAGDNIIILYKQ